MTLFKLMFPLKTRSLAYFACSHCRYVAVVAIFAGAQTDANAQTLQAALSDMLQNYPQLRAAAENTKAIEQSIHSEKSTWRPQVNFNARGGGERYEDVLSRNFANGESSNASFLAQQLLYDGGLAKSRVNIATHQYRSSARTLDDLRESKALELSVVYIDIIKHRRLIQLAEANVRAHQEALEKINRKHLSGAAPRADVDLLKARKAMAVATLESRRLQLRRSETTYAKLTGKIPGPFERPEFPNWAMPMSPDETDLAGSPSIQAAKHNIDMARAERKGAHSKFRPQLSLALQNDFRDSSRASNIGEEASAMLVFSYDIFDGGRRRSELRRNNTLISKAEFEFEQSVLETQERYVQAIDELSATDERIYQLELYSQSIETVARAYQEQFSIGQRALINLLDIENELFSARSSLEEEQLIRYQAAYRLIAAAGQLVETIESEVQTTR